MSEPTARAHFVVDPRAVRRLLVPADGARIHVSIVRDAFLAGSAGRALPDELRAKLFIKNTAVSKACRAAVKTVVGSGFNRQMMIDGVTKPGIHGWRLRATTVMPRPVLSRAVRMTIRELLDKFDKLCDTISSMKLTTAKRREWAVLTDDQREARCAAISTGLLARSAARGIESGNPRANYRRKMYARVNREATRVDTELRAAPSFRKQTSIVKACDPYVAWLALFGKRLPKRLAARLARAADIPKKRPPRPWPPYQPPTTLATSIVRGATAFLDWCVGKTPQSPTRLERPARPYFCTR